MESKQQHVHQVMLMMQQLRLLTQRQVTSTFVFVLHLRANANRAKASQRILVKNSLDTRQTQITLSARFCNGGRSEIMFSSVYKSNHTHRSMSIAILCLQQLHETILLYKHHLFHASDFFQWRGLLIQSTETGFLLKSFLHCKHSARTSRCLIEPQ